MDTASRTLTGTTGRVIRPAAAVLAAAAILALIASTVGLFRAAVGASDRPAAPAAPAVTTITGGDEEARAAVTWALGRYGAAGIEALPAVAIHLHPGETGCRGNLGYYRAGRLDLCTAASSEPYARKLALHELAHAWTATHLDAETQARFLELRGLEAWNASDDAWKVRGIEQAAEIVAWGLGEGEIRPLLPEPATDAELDAAFELLTGEPPITTAP